MYKTNSLVLKDKRLRCINSETLKNEFHSYDNNENIPFPLHNHLFRFVI